MLRSYEKGFAVMNKELNALSFEGDLETCKRYCRNGDVITERIPYVYGFSIRVVWHKFWFRPISFRIRYREANFFYLHIKWYKEFTHKTGKIVYNS